MAITKTRTLNEVRVSPEVPHTHAGLNIDGEVISGSYTYVIDDTEDSELPITTQKPFTLQRADYPDNINGHDPLVQTICNAVWVEEE